VRETLRRWQKGGLGGLWDTPGRGMKQRWCETDMQYLEERLDQDQRTYNSVQLSALLEQQRGAKLSADRVRRILQKRGSTGSVPSTASRATRTQSTNSASKLTSTH
jgi:transposase